MALKIGDKAPEFTLPDTERKNRTLSELRGPATVLAFYPGAFTGACTREMCEIRDAMSSFNIVDAHVIGISVDAPFANKAFAAQNNLQFPLLSDHTRIVSKQYAGVYENFAGLAGYSAAKRSVFVLDKGGIVRYVWVTEDPGVPPNLDEVKKAIASLT